MTAECFRKGKVQDSSQLYALMLKLAKFEGYFEQFLVTEQDVKTRGFGPDPSFHTLVAEQNSTLSGMLIYYLLPFTYDLKSWFFIKDWGLSTTKTGSPIPSIYQTA